MKRIFKHWIPTVFVLLSLVCESLFAQNTTAPDPLFRDPVYDGAADPVVFWNHIEKEWWMFYTQRRANENTADVAFCFGNSIDIA